MSEFLFITSSFFQGSFIYISLLFLVKGLFRANKRHVRRTLTDLVSCDALDTGDESHPAGVSLELRSPESLPLGTCELFVR